MHINHINLNFSNVNKMYVKVLRSFDQLLKIFVPGKKERTHVLTITGLPCRLLIREVV